MHQKHQGAVSRRTCEMEKLKTEKSIFLNQNTWNKVANLAKQIMKTKHHKGTSFVVRSDYQPVYLFNKWNTKTVWICSLFIEKYWSNPDCFGVSSTELFVFQLNVACTLYNMAIGAANWNENMSNPNIKCCVKTLVSFKAVKQTSHKKAKAHFPKAM